MNICFLIHSFSNQAGTESYVYHMSMAMAELGHRVHIVSLTGQGRWDFKAWDDKITLHKFDSNKNPHRRFKSLERLLPMSLWHYGQSIGKLLPTIVEDHAIDIIEATDWGMDAWRYLPQRQVPVCVRLHGYPGFKCEFDDQTLKKGMKKWISWNIHRNHIRTADLITCVSKAYADFVRQAWDIKDQEMEVIPIAVDTGIFRPAPVCRDERSVLFVGRIEALKGIGILEQAIPAILNQAPETRFLFAGVDHPREQTRQTWSQHLLTRFGQKHIVCLGSLPTQDLVRHYQESTLCVVPSLYEPGGTVAFEAMASECPVLASEVGGLAEVIKDRQTGLLVPPGDPAALAAGLLELLQDSSLRQELARNARAAVCQNFDIKQVAQQTLASYGKAISAFRMTNRRGCGHG